MASMNILPPLLLDIPKYSTLHPIQIPQLLTPPPLWNFWLFFRPFGIPFWLYKTSNKWEIALFPPPRKFWLVTIFSQTNKQLKFVTNT